MSVRPLWLMCHYQKVSDMPDVRTIIICAALRIIIIIKLQWTEHANDFRERDWENKLTKLMQTVKRQGQRAFQVQHLCR